MADQRRPRQRRSKRAVSNQVDPKEPGRVTPPEGDRSLPKTPPAGGEYYVFRDAVHNIIEIDDESEGRYLRAVLDTREVQRLRRIRQNGLSALVYQSLEGSRFPHALGAFHIARKIIRHLRANEPRSEEGFPQLFHIDDRTSIAFPIAALLHDIGHGPLSHIWEDIFDFHHEEAGVAILTDTSSRLNKLLSRPSAIDESFAKFDGIINDILSFYDQTHHLHYLLSLISGHLDVDRLDFMARDTRAAGVTYGFHDLEWIIRSLRFARIPTHVRPDGTVVYSRWVVAIDGRKGVNTLVQFLRARENMYSLVYYHKTSRAAQCLLSKIFFRVDALIKQGKPPDICAPHLGDWMLGDHSARILSRIEDEDLLCSIKVWAESRDPILSVLCTKFLERDLYKVVEVSADVAGVLRTIDDDNHGRHLLKAIENAVDPANLANVPSDRQYWYGFDETHFDLIGDPKNDDAHPIWIIQFGRFGLEYTPLRKFWIEQLGEGGLAKSQHYVHCFNSHIAQAVRTYVERLPSFSTDSEGTMPPSVHTYKPIRLISKSGASKAVYLGVNMAPGSTTRTLVAMKYYKDATNVDRDLEKPNLRLENADRRNITLASGYKHPSGSREYILIESCWHASIEALVMHNGLRRSLSEILDIGRQLFRGLSILHERGIRHTDIKLDNCGYNYDRELRVYKIGDFGCMSLAPGELPVADLAGTKRTIAPERLLAGSPRIGLSSDVWALGVTIYALCAGEYWFMPITVPHQGEGRAPQVQERLREIEASIVADLPRAVQAFRDRANRALPPILAQLLAPCFAEYGRREDAASVATAFEQVHSTLAQKPKDEQKQIMSLWRQFEDLKSVSNFDRIDELRTTNKDYLDYVPPDLLIA